VTITGTAGDTAVNEDRKEAVGGFVRIGVAGPRTRVDLAVPAGVRLAAVLPNLLQHVTEPADREAVPGGWALSRVDGTRLSPASTLRASGIRDGELLMLHPAREANPPPLYDDVVEVIGENAIGEGWASRHTRAASGVIVSVAVLGALAAAGFGHGTLPGLLAAVASVLLLLGGGALSRGLGDLPAGTLIAALAVPAGAVAATRLLGGAWGAGHVLLASAVVLLMAALAPVVVGGGEAAFAAFGVAGLFGLAGSLIVVLNAGGVAAAAAAVAPLGLAATTLMPTLALRASQLPRPQLPRNADDLKDVAGALELQVVEHRVVRARRLLSGLLAGCDAVAGAGAIILAATGDTWALVLSAVLVLLISLRARLFRDTVQVAVPVATAVVTLAALTVTALLALTGDNARLLGVLAPILLLAGLVAGLVGVTTGRRPANPRLARLLDLMETALLLSVVPLALAVWDVYRALLDLAS
jgi:type VII secretion integral membrane protein EccD